MGRLVATPACLEKVLVLLRAHYCLMLNGTGPFRGRKTRNDTG